MKAKEIIARRAAKEFKDGDLVNLGIGLPTMASNYIPEGVDMLFQSENGFTGMGPNADETNKDEYITNAGGQYVTILPGGAFFDSTYSFCIMRGHHLDATLLGAFEVDEKGNIASWMVPGKRVTGMGGAMDLLYGAKRVIVVMTHTTKDGSPKIFKKCTLPLTAAGKVDTIITEKGVFKVTENGLVLLEIGPDTTVEDIKNTTDADFTVAEDLKKMEI